jgi:hypothetical protein
MKWLTIAALLGILGFQSAAGAQVKSITINAGGVFCMSCSHRLEKAMQRLECADQIKIKMEPNRAELTPRGGKWVAADRLRAAVKTAGFKPGAIRYTIDGKLTQWQGQTALQLQGSEQLVVLQPRGEAPQAFDRIRDALGRGDAASVEIEGLLTEEKSKGKTPPVLQVVRAEISR